MQFDDRLAWWLFGCAIGFVVGYIVRTLREIKADIEEVDEHVKTRNNEDGIVRYPLVLDAALLLVVLVTVYAAFASQRASNDVADTQDRITRITVCNQQYLAKTIAALNERTTYTQEQVAANVGLNKAVGEFFTTIFENAGDDGAELRAFRTYLNAYDAYVVSADEALKNSKTTPYPTNEELAKCLAGTPKEN